MKNQEYTVSNAIVEELVAEGVEVVYGIVSVHNMPIYNAILNHSKIRMVTARGESGAVNMADAYARTTGKLGVVITSTGTGAGNAAGSLSETWNSGTSLLHITGEVDSNYIGTDQRYIHESKDQLKMMEGVNKATYLLKRPKLITPFMRKAIKEAQTAPQGPVTVQIPTNFQAQIIPNNQLIEVELKQNRETTINLPTEIVETIATAKRPVVWAGNGVILSGASEELLELVEKIKPAVITSAAGKGSIPENHPLCIGNFAYFPQFEELLKKSDLLISIGVRFRAGETNNWTSPVPENHINIDADPNAFNRNFNTRCGVVGDAKAVLREINKQLVDKEITTDEAYVEEVKGTRQAVRYDLSNSIKPYGDFATIMREQLPDNTVLVTDVTIPGYTWANKLFDINEPKNYVTMTGEGIGQGLPMAIGAKVGQPNKPVVLVAGDGGFMVNAGEMITAVHENTPIIVLLFDDGGYGILKYYQEAAYGRKINVDLKNPDFVMMAKSMGFESEKVASVEEFEKGLANAIASQKPYLVVVDVEKVGILEYEDSDEYIQSFRPHEE
ncbi:thiamine pyrophosphate-binding protein [Ornithinibacillus halophilus]|uniref:Acetolactate synthase-1/2/3 large subunit n=1 Tax=Ornithinibacillus halophilus TaxID=930117 RepID=A0A1M5MWY2_9BACI|nr:thiamine pyrophosphate-binding protein [Ornithinibacillus halophilus]SHG81808.1 acetolactate synthase-1/2/3 large subunit [Ornithinibacillus halophilus]